MFELYFTGDPLVIVFFSYTDTAMTRMMGARRADFLHHLGDQQRGWKGLHHVGSSSVDSFTYAASVSRELKRNMAWSPDTN